MSLLPKTCYDVIIMEDSGKTETEKMMPYSSTEKHKCHRTRRRFSRESPYHQFMRRRSSTSFKSGNFHDPLLARRRRARRRGGGGLLARFFLLLSFLRIIGCNYIKVETYNTRHLALPPSLARPNDRRQAAKAAEGSYCAEHP